MAHLQRLLDRARATPQTIQPRIEIWPPGPGMNDLSEPAEGTLRAPLGRNNEPGSVGIPRETATVSTTATTVVGQQAARTPIEVTTGELARTPSDRNSEGDDLPRRRPPVPAPAPLSAPLSSRQTAAQQATPSLVPAVPGPPTPPPLKKVAASWGPLQGRELPQADPSQLTIRRPLALPFVPPRGESRTRTEPDVIISIGRIEVRAPSSEGTQPRSKPAGKPADVERLERYLNIRAGGRSA